MRLEISSYIENNKARLEFQNSPSKPKSAPTYIVDKSKADEFVKKYNKQEKNLNKITKVLAVAGTTLGAISAFLYKGVLPKILGCTIGAGVGIVTGLVYSAKKKRNLMDKYNIKEFSLK